MSYEIKEVQWFSRLDVSYGIVAVRNNRGEMKAYLGSARGVNSHVDAEHIAEYGAPFTNPAACAALFPRYVWPGAEIMKDMGGTKGAGGMDVRVVSEMLATIAAHTYYFLRRRKRRKEEKKGKEGKASTWTRR